MKIFLKRIFKNGWLNFKRSQGLSIITVFVMFLTISMVSSIFLFKGIGDFLLVSLESKIDISVYFKEGISEQEILNTKDLLLEIEGVKKVNYVSQEEAIAKFRERYQDDEVILQALEEVGGNPFLASLEVTAADTLNYENVTGFLEENRFEGLINNVDYYQRKPVIEKFYDIKGSFERSGLFASLILALVAFSITLVTVRLAIYSASEEIGIMRLVGASNWFIRGQFVVHGMICGGLAMLAALVIFPILSYIFSSKLLGLTGGFDLFDFYLKNFVNILGIQFLTGIGLGSASSVIAVRKYLEK
ncbi:permease-like cell division protein FtsX [Candidatus Parcubacteria bacterium]|nr:permease-like cell division protein FtsX [Patescibacteria group bacterium]MCG2688104.1 permease-like cell division protein FtsX [Candidatus Parcubacteria bacterium]